MKLEGYFLAIVRNQVFDPGVGAESLGSLQAIPPTREDIVWNVTIIQVRQEGPALGHALTALPPVCTHH